MDRNNYDQYNGQRDDYRRRGSSRWNDDWRDDEIAGASYGDWDETSSRDLSRASNYTSSGDRGRNRGDYGSAGAGRWTEDDRSRRELGGPRYSGSQSYGTGQSYGSTSSSYGSGQPYGGGEYYGARRGGYAMQQRGGFQSFRPDDYGGADFTSHTYGTPYGGYGSSYTTDEAASGSYGYASAGRDRTGSRMSGSSYDYDRSGNYGSSQRGFMERASDEVASWFGDEEAARRREMDHTGRGPSNYSRSDDRIREDVCDRLTDDWQVDASEVNVSVDDGEVTLDGTVDSRAAKRRAEDCVERISGVRHVQNNLRVRDTTRSATGTTSTGTLGSSTTSESQYSSH